MNRETTVPESAVESLAALLYEEQRTYSQPTWTAPDPKPPGRSYLNQKRRSMWRNRARKLLQAALPAIAAHLRSEWEASLPLPKKLSLKDLQGIEVPDAAIDTLAACLACHDVNVFREMAEKDPDWGSWKRREAEGYLQQCIAALSTTGGTGA